MSRTASLYLISLSTHFLHDVVAPHLRLGLKIGYLHDTAIAINEKQKTQGVGFTMFGTTQALSEPSGSNTAPHFTQPPKFKPAIEKARIR